MVEAVKRVRGLLDSPLNNEGIDAVKAFELDDSNARSPTITLSILVARSLECRELACRAIEQEKS